ncbi:MAG: thioredoxin [Alphaproteobacteria bacterium]|nr:thioredoxin [Alphaproteobacteria bacterium]MBN2779445.1 thioredoxin [Alphaproteobacteria bacterium]
MQQISDAQFEEKVLKAKGVAVVDFFAPWCGPCKQFLPIITQVSEELGDKAGIYKMNVDEDQKYAGEFGVRSIPTILFFKDGELQDTHIGSMDADTLKSKIQAL